MALFLYRLGRFSFRNRWWVLGTWLALLIAAGGAAATLSGPTSESFSIPGVPSLEAYELQQQRFMPPGQAMDAAADLMIPANAQLVFAAPEGETITDEANQAIIQTLVDALQGSSQVVAVVPPIPQQSITPDGRVGFARVQYSVDAIGLDEETREHLQAVVEEARARGLQVEVGGDVLQQIPEAAAGEVVGLVVAALVLFITLGSLVAAGLPLITGILGVGIGVSLVTAASGFIELSSTAPVLASMLGLAVAIDYSLFILTRYRHEVRKGVPLEEAIGRAVGTAGGAVVFAGLTVIIALCGLAVVNISFLTVMGLAAALTVGIAVLIAITLLPALFALTGRRAAGLKKDEAAAHAKGEAPIASTKPKMGERWGRFVTNNRVAVLLVSIVGLGIIATPALDLQLALPGPATAPEDSTDRKAYDLLSEGFGPGFNGPLQIVVDVIETEPDGRQAAIDAVAAELATLDNVQSLSPVTVNPAGDTGVMTLIPMTGPIDEATTDLVDQIRSLEFAGTELGVTGLPAIEYDVSARLADAMVPYLAIVVGLAIIILLIVFRSVIVPIKATLGFILTIAATFGAVVAVFQWGWLGGLIGLDSTGPIMSMLPIFMIGVVFGLAMDYQVFLVTRMREEFIHGASANEAVVHGVSHGARVVTAAALIMISVFTGFVLAGDQIIMQIGLAMAVGVAIDAFIVRMTIVPAFMSLIGNAGWWIPRWLSAIVPNVDVEGDQLMKHIREREAAASKAPAE